MKIAKCQNGYILALKAELKDGPFRCPECRCEVIVKKGDIYTHHFAHHPGEGCAMGDVADGEWTGESQLHQYAKKEMYETLSKHPDVTQFPRVAQRDNTKQANKDKNEGISLKRQCEKDVRRKRAWGEKEEQAERRCGKRQERA